MAKKMSVYERATRLVGYIGDQIDSQKGFYNGQVHEDMYGRLEGCIATAKELVAQATAAKQAGRNGQYTSEQLAELGTRVEELSKRLAQAGKFSPVKARNPEFIWRYQIQR